MKVEELNKVENIPGIYKIQNLINGKCYIGQSIRLRKRLLKHISAFKARQYDLPIYRAFDKYGLENFDFQILEMIDTTDYNAIKKVLDELEKKYIIKFNSCEPSGYNPIKDLTIEMPDTSDEDSSSNWLYAFDTKDRKYIVAIDSISMFKALSRIEPDLKEQCINTGLYSNRFIISDSKENLDKLIGK